MNESYIASIQRVEDHIERHLTEDLRLDELARVAGFSPFHFHRVFRAVTGETLHQHVTRRRIERAAAQLRDAANKSITDIAFDCGFSGSAPFARAFKRHFGVTASDWRALRTTGATAEVSKIHQTNRKIWQEAEITQLYGEDLRSPPRWRISVPGLEGQVHIETFAPKPVAYVRHVGPFAGNVSLFADLYQKLVRWAEPKGLLDRPGLERFGIYYDDAKITEHEHLRLSVAITVPDGTRTDGDVGSTTIDAGTYAVGRFRLTPEQHRDAWALLYGVWLPQSGYVPDDRPTLERFESVSPVPNSANVVSVCVPVKPG